MTVPDLLRAFDRVIAVDVGLFRAADGKHGRPTPCREWNVRQLLCHLVFINERYAIVAEREATPPFEQPTYPDVGAAFATWSARAREAFRQPGFLGEVMPTPIGEQSGSVVVQHVLNELVAHSWDLARGLGEPTDLVPDLAEAALRSWKVAFAEFGEPPRTPSVIDTVKPVPANASAADRLAAWLGREV
ncbi:MAG TPA: TIGR03086 family metal-binding protein [Stackebrandtia sp.]|uniref:TIGR03086 family metal-binding protein n=1 Tax=Stackebrandtia sp. TaxID=2023065 RepID=UPI002D50AF55|nr:TIGR03086 family metal-binding protein [Stackebrandtia sp.]HZE38454.1 TIGR03086 family metal-binding protein [Stackebrandtia sp.]